MKLPLHTRILYVEDDTVDQMVFSRMLKKTQNDFEYTIASSVGEARSIMEFNSFDVIITDYNLGDGTAKDVMLSVGKIPTILTSCSDDMEIGMRASEIGANDY